VSIIARSERQRGFFGERSEDIVSCHQLLSSPPNILSFQQLLSLFSSVAPFDSTEKLTPDPTVISSYLNPTCAPHSRDTTTRLYELERQKIEDEYKKGREAVRARLLDQVDERRKKVKEEKESTGDVVTGTWESD
jgi:hypothetical protein